MIATLSDINIRECADKTYELLLPVWEDGLDQGADGYGWLLADYWKGGNTLDAVINYLCTSGLQDTRKFVERSLKLYGHKSKYPDGGAWRDDYGWWGKAFVNAYINAKKLGLDDATTKKCLAEADNCWTILNKSASENQSYGKGFDTAKKLVGAAYCAWNNDGAAEYFKSDTSRFLDPHTPNSITNAGYLAISTELRDNPNIKYRSVISTCYEEWLLMAFEFSASGFPNALLNDYSLIRETVRPDMHMNWCFDLDRAWSADQGIYIYNMLVATSKESFLPPAIKTRIQKLLDRLLSWYSPYPLNGDKNAPTRSWNSLIVDGIFRDFETKTIPSFLDANLSNYNNNYVTGPGVFTRYLGNGFALLSDQYKELFRPILEKSATSAWENRDQNTDQIRCWYAPFEKSPYWQYYQWDKEHNNERDPDNKLWELAPQVAGLDLFVACLKAQHS